MSPIRDSSSWARARIPSCSRKTACSFSGKLWAFYLKAILSRCVDFHFWFLTGLRPTPLNETRWCNSRRHPVMAGLVWGFFCQEGFRIFRLFVVPRERGLEPDRGRAPGLRSLGNARGRCTEPRQGRSRRRRGPKARLYEAPVIAENRPPRSVGRLAIARCSTCLPFLDECGRGWISSRS